MEKLKLPNDTSVIPIPYLPPLSPRPSTKNFLRSLAGRYSASYTVTPNSSKLSKKQVKADDFCDVDYVRTRSYSPLKAQHTFDESFSDVDSVKSSSTYVPSCTSSSNSTLVFNPRSSRAHSEDSAFGSSCPSSPSLRSSRQKPDKTCEQIPSRVPRSLSCYGAPSPVSVTNSNSLPDEYCRANNTNPSSSSSSRFSHLSSSTDSKGEYVKNCPSSASTRSSSVPLPERVPSLDENLKRSSIEEWILCTVKRANLNRRVAAMTNLSMKHNVDQYMKWLQG